ncbi:MAG TPA: hypothetical protein VNA25_02025, partial [Phycisphaerae bacterium]|nr:hypothetical protein [Phycisphaerae bacterium]
MLLLEPFAHFQTAKGALDLGSLDEADSECTRREVLLRFLALSAVLDQGPDSVGVRLLVRLVTEELYRQGIRFLHRPLLFFQNLARVLVVVHEANNSVTETRAKKWAEENQSSPG